MKRLILGREHVDTTGAVEIETVLAQLGEVMASMGYPAPYRGDADPQALEFRPMYHHYDDVLGNQFFSPPTDGSDPRVIGNYLEHSLSGNTYTEGIGISIAADVIDVRLQPGGGILFDGNNDLYAASSASYTGEDGILVDGTEISVDLMPGGGLDFDGSGKLFAEVSTPYTPGEGIDITGVDISVDLRATLPGLEFEVGTEKLFATPYTAGSGITVVDYVITATGGGGGTTSDTERFYLMIKGDADVTVDEGAGFNITNAVIVEDLTVHIPVGTGLSIPNPTGNTIPVVNTPKLRTDGTETVYARYNFTTGTWFPDSLHNAAAFLRGRDNWDVDEFQVLGHSKAFSTMKWQVGKSLNILVDLV